MKKNQDIRELSSILDEHIEKGIKKGMSFNPYAPMTMDADMPYYCPYALGQDGAFFPHPVEYWETRGTVKNDTDYRLVKEFYNAAGVAQRTIEGFRGLAKSIPTLIKAIPVGHKHTYKDGKEYQKVSDKHWRETMHDDSPESGDHIEQHAEKVGRIKGHIEKKHGDNKLVHRARKETMRQVRTVLKQLFDGGVPDDIKPHFDLRRKPNE